MKLITTKPQFVPANFQDWYNSHFRGQTVKLVPFDHRQPAPNLRQKKVDTLARQASFNNLLQKIRF